MTDAVRHANFFRGLRAFIEHYSAVVELQAVVSMRLEYLVTFDGTEARSLLRAFNAVGPEMRVYNLVLQLFDSSRVERYLKRRFARGGAALFERVRKYRELFQILHRPLLLKIFGDLVQSDPDQVGKLLSFKDPSQLFDRYVKHARQKAEVAQEKLGSSYSWSNEQLAARAVMLFRDGRVRLDRKDTEAIREPIRDLTSSADQSEDVFFVRFQVPFFAAS